jgi:hypothetical protein
MVCRLRDGLGVNLFGDWRREPKDRTPGSDGGNGCLPSGDDLA